MFPSTATNAAQSERRVIQFPLCIIVIIGRYQNASQTCYKSSHYFILKNSSISIWTSKQGCIWRGVSESRVWSRDTLAEEAICALFFFIVQHLISINLRSEPNDLMGYSCVFCPLDPLGALTKTECGAPSLMAETDFVWGSTDLLTFVAPLPFGGDYHPGATVHHVQNARSFHFSEDWVSH